MPTLTDSYINKEYQIVYDETFEEELRKHSEYTEKQKMILQKNLQYFCNQHSIYNDLMNHKITKNELEKYIQKKYPNSIQNFIDNYCAGKKNLMNLAVRLPSPESYQVIPSKLDDNFISAEYQERYKEIFEERIQPDKRYKQMDIYSLKKQLHYYCNQRSILKAYLYNQFSPEDIQEYTKDLFDTISAEKESHCSQNVKEYMICTMKQVLTLAPNVEVTRYPRPLENGIQESPDDLKALLNVQQLEFLGH